MTNIDRFFNPYNFVRYLPAPRPSSSSKVDQTPDQLLLTRCPPPPHDRFVGLSGKIACTLTAVTPLFVSDSEQVQEVDGGHDCKSYRFFRLPAETGEEEYAIPATSLKGAFRNVFEAVTNSCFAVFEGGLLGKRERPERYKRELLAGRIRRLPRDPSHPGKIEIMDAYRLPHRRFNKYRDKTRDNGRKVFVRVDPGEKIVTAISNNPRTGYQKGYLKTSGPGIGRGGKKHERVFLPRDPGEAEGTAQFVALPFRLYQDYVISNKNNKYEHTKKPEVGDTVWCAIDHSSREADVLAYTKIYRKPFPASIDELLPDYLHPCSRYEALCPACRAFGWVSPDPDAAVSARGAYAGRVNLTPARLTGKPRLLDGCPVTLAILGTPKPTTTWFYLLDKHGQPAFNITYQKGARLRGRKFYRHHSETNLLAKEYARAGGVTDNQNRVLRDVLAPGATFTFELWFQNLAPVELGALLWALELEDGMHHRVGLGKPLGLGSVRVAVSSLAVLNPARRYARLADGGWQAVTRPGMAALVDHFKAALVALHAPEQAFDRLANVQDLQALLSTPPGETPVHYPRLTPDPDPDGKNFEWFMQNQRRLHQALGLAPTDPGLGRRQAVPTPESSRGGGGPRTSGSGSGAASRASPGSAPGAKRGRGKGASSADSRARQAGGTSEVPFREKYLAALADCLRSRCSDLSHLIKMMKRKKLHPTPGYKTAGFRKFKAAVLAAIEAHALPCTVDDTPQARIRWPR